MEAGTANLVCSLPIGTIIIIDVIMTGEQYRVAGKVREADQSLPDPGGQQTERGREQRLNRQTLFTQVPVRNILRNILLQ